MPTVDRSSLRDVAAAAGVSAATVSRVLSGSRPVRSDTAAKVRQIADELDYRPHHTAKALRRQQTDTFGMVVPHIANPFFPSLVQAIERRLHGDHSLTLVLCDSQDDVTSEAERLVALVDRQVDGLVVIPIHLAESGAGIERVRRHVPVVQVDRWTEGADTDIVSMDNAHGIGMAVDHLIGLGCHRFAVVGASRTGSAARERAHGAVTRIRSHGAAVVAELDGTFTTEFGVEAATQLLAGADRPDAIVCENDLIALGVLQALIGRGVVVPDEIAVTGFDGIVFTDLVSPRLTTVVQPVDAMADLIATRLLARIGGDESPSRHHRLQGALRVRESTVGVDR